MRVNPPRNGTFWQYVMRRTRDPASPVTTFITGLLKYRRRFTEVSLAEHLFEENVPKSDVLLYIQIVKDWQDWKARRYRVHCSIMQEPVIAEAIMKAEERLERRKFNLSERIRKNSEEWEMLRMQQK